MRFQPTREALAWAGGFFAGEGSVHICYNGGKPKNLPYPQVAISQSGDLGREVLDRFHIATGALGKIYGPKPPGRNQKQIRWLWEANGFEKTQAIMALLWPWLGSVKQSKFEYICRAYLTARGY